MHSSPAKAELEPFFFGPPTQPLFGCYHAPRAGSMRKCGVVLCPPMGHEYIASHRAYRQLATRLAQAGFPVLRFDFYGCGDSAGDRHEGQMRHWLGDIAAACSEIRTRCGYTQVCMIGMRLGATLAAMVGAERGDIAGMVLWDPVVYGPAYVQELTTMHEAMLQRSHVLPQHCSTGEKPSEVLGFPLSETLLAELEGLDLLAMRCQPAPDVLCIETDERVEGETFRERLHSCGARVAYRYLPGPSLWTEDIYKVLVPQQVLHAVVSWMSAVYP